MKIREEASKMKRLRDMKIGMKLLLGFSVVILLMGIIGYTGYKSTLNVKRGLDNIFGKRLPSLNNLIEADRDLQQLLVAERSMIFSHPEAAEFQEFVNTYNVKMKQSETRFNEYKKLADTPEEQEIILKYDQARKEWEEISRKVVEGRIEDTREGRRLAIDLTLGQAKTTFEEMRNYLSQLEEINLAIAEMEQKNAHGIYRMSSLTILAVVALALIVGITVALFLSRGITTPLKKCVALASSIKEKDLTHRIDVNKNDETGELAFALSEMASNLIEMIGRIQGLSEEVATSSQEMSANAEQMSEGAQNQASTLEETSASVEELSASVEQVADHAQSQISMVEEGTSNMEKIKSSADQVSQTLTTVSQTANEAVEKAKEGAESVVRVIESIRSISDSSDKITGIVSVISDIADQTNLLALNASIEAARAGEHGRGFAVVADEVSKLADRSATSTKEIGHLIKESEKVVKAGVEIAQGSGKAMEEIIGGSKKSSELITDLSNAIERQTQAIQHLGKTLEQISEMSQGIGAATEEQTTNAKQVMKAIENVNEVTQQAASSAEEMSASTQQLSTMAQELQILLDTFKMNGSLRSPEKLKVLSAQKNEKLRDRVEEDKETTSIAVAEEQLV